MAVSSVGQYLGELKAITQSQRHNSDDIWSALTRSLMGVSEQFGAWGRVMNSVIDLPSFEITMDVAQNLDVFESSWQDIDHWLKQQKKDVRCQDLREGLRSALKDWQSSRSKSALSAYLQSRRNKNLVMAETVTEIDRRFHAANGLLALALAIKEALDHASGVR